jgi:hypothetical protein
MKGLQQLCLFCQVPNHKPSQTTVNAEAKGEQN